MKNWLARGFFLSILLSAALAYAAGNGGQKPRVEVQTTDNLQALGHQAAQKRLPILVMFSATHCPYCELLESEILRPMLISGDYTNKVIIRKVNLDTGTDIIDFKGNRISASDFATYNNVFVTPTMLFFGPDGKELTQRMIGINTVEMFGGDVDAAIDASLAQLRKPAKVARNP